MAATQSPPVTAAEYADAVFRLRRSLRRAVRANMDGPALPTAEGELLGLVHRSDGIGVAEAAAALQVAPNTVSTLVGHLVGVGLLSRHPNPSDRRAALLGVTPAGDRRVVESRQRRAAVIDHAFESLTPADRALVLGSLPALEALIAALGDGRIES